MDYWEECISEAFEDAGIKATEEQIQTVSSWVRGSHENYGMAHGYDAIPSPYLIEKEKLEKQMKAEKENFEQQRWQMEKDLAEERRSYRIRIERLNEELGRR